MSFRILVVTPKSLFPRFENYPVELIENQFTVGSLRQFQLVDRLDVIYWDEYRHRHGVGAEDYIIEYCETNAPDVVVFGAQPAFYKLLNKIEEPSALDVLKIASSIKSFKAHLWWDHISPYNKLVAHEVGKHMNVNVVMDTVDLEDSPDNFITKWYPIDSSLYRSHARDIDVSFIGTVVPLLKQRVECMTYLDQERVPVYLSPGAYSSTPLTLNQYASILSRSKIALNFTYLDICGRDQCKSRTFEAACAGAMLLESENNITNRYFEPYVDYVPFKDKVDLKDKIRYYLEHEDERNKIAESGHKKQRELYNENKFWSEVLVTNE